jgi:hypothetical protein
MTNIKTTVNNRRIDVPAPSDIPDGTEVMLTITQSSEDGPLSSEEIDRVLAAMQKLDTLDIPEDVAADLEDWEKKINQHGTVVTMESDFLAVPDSTVDNCAAPLGGTGT